jgi:dihydropteroate synthase
VDLGLPVLVGASRKRFLGAVLVDAEGRPRGTADREAATLATTVLAARAGVWAVRVHDVPGNADAVRVAGAVPTSRAAASAGPGGRGASRPSPGR